MWQVDFDWSGFCWIANDDCDQSVIAFRRFDQEKNELIIVCNFVPVEREDYRIGVPYDGVYEEVFSSDAQDFGGSGITNGRQIESDPEQPMHGLGQSISLHLPPLSVLYLQYAPKKKKKPRAKKAQKVDKKVDTSVNTSEQPPVSEDTVNRTQRAAGCPDD